MKPGQWSIDLLPDTPKEVTDVLRFGSNRWSTSYAGLGTIWVTPTRLDLAEVGLSGVMDAAVYAGRYMEQTNRTTLSGDDINAWLGDSDGKGSLDTYNHTAANFSTWITDATTILAHTITPGTITDPGGTFTWNSVDLIVNRDALVAINRGFGTEWRLNPDLTFDAGTRTALYGSTPAALWMPTARYDDPDLVIVSSRTPPTHTVSLRDFVYEVFPYESITSYGVGIRSSAPVVSDPWYPASAGARPQIYRRMGTTSSSGSTANLDAQAAAFLAFTPMVQESIEISIDDYDPTLALCGKSLYLYDPARDIDDPTATQLWVAGDLIRPMTQRVFQIEWEFPRNGGLYFQDANGNNNQADRSVYDLSRWVDRSGLTGTARVTCGALLPQWETIARNKYEEWSS